MLKAESEKMEGEKLRRCEGKSNSEFGMRKWERKKDKGERKKVEGGRPRLFRRNDRSIFSL